MSKEGQRPDSKPKLSAKDVSIINVAVAAAQNRSGELSTCGNRTLQDNGSWLKALRRNKSS
jgi:hypothetical protein